MLNELLAFCMVAQEEHFADVGKVSKVENNAEMKVDDIKLTRYACYLIAQNVDSRKKHLLLQKNFIILFKNSKKVI